MSTRAIMGVCAALLLWASCSGTNPVAPLASATIGGEGGEVHLDNGTTIQVPAGALPGDVTVTIAESSATSPDAVGPAYVLGPEGTTFTQPVTLTFPIDTALLGNNGTDDLIVLTAPAGTTNFTSLGGELVDSTHVAAKTTHFSIFMVARPARTLATLTVTPASASIARGTTQQLTATGTYSDNTTQDLTTQVTWGSADSQIATVTRSGLATGTGVGSTAVTATLLGRTGSTTLAVTDATLISIDVTPTNPTIARGATQRFAATGRYSDGSTQDLTATVRWSSSASSIATVSSTEAPYGVASGIAVGTSTITATLGQLAGSTTLTVSDASLVSIAVTPADPKLAKGATTQLRAIGLYSDDSTQDLTAQVTWSSSAESVATVSNEVGRAGFARALAIGTTTIGATLAGTTGTTMLEVTDAELVSVEVMPSAPSIAKGTTLQLNATGVYGDGSRQDLTATATWSSSNGVVASISNAPESRGVATGLDVGTTAITATVGTIGGSVTLTVTTATLVSITIDPVDPTIAAGATLPFVATGFYDDMRHQDLTAQVTWTSSLPEVATVSNADGSVGVATGVAGGVTTITATLDGVTGQTQLTVGAAAQILISGVVRDATTRQPVANAEVLFEGTGVGMTRTDASGVYVFTSNNLRSESGSLSGTLYVTTTGYFEAARSVSSVPATQDVDLTFGGTQMTGTITDATTRAPITDAMVTVAGGNPLSRFQGGVHVAPDGTYQVDSSVFNESALTSGFSIDLAVMARGYQTATASSSFTVGPVVHDIALTAATALLTGVVRDGAGQPVANAQVLFEGTAFGITSTDGNGVYVFTSNDLHTESGTVSGTLYVGKTGYFEAARPISSVPATQDVSLRVGGAVMTGTVTDGATGAPIAFAMVDIMGGSPLGTIGGSIVSEADGSYRIDSSWFLDSAPESGFTIDLRVTARGYQSATSSLSFSAYPAAHDVALTAEAALVSGVVRDANGQPVPEALVIFEGSAFGRTITDADGAYVFTSGDLRSDGESVSGTLYVGKTGYFEAARSIPAVPASQDITLMTGGPVLTGTITDSGTSAPIAFAMIDVVGGSSLSKLGASAHSEADGTYQIDSSCFNESALESGFALDLMVSASGYQSATASVSFTAYPAVRNVALVAGQPQR